MTPYLKKAALFPAQIGQAPAKDLGLVVVIPAYKEEQLLKSLESLRACALPKCAVEVIVIINDGEEEDPKVKSQNQAIFIAAQKWAKINNTDRLSFFILYHTDLPRKHAGVGLARKIGMDEAIYRFSQVDYPLAIISCYDADSACEQNYLQAIEDFFSQHPESKAASIHYEHPVEGSEFSREIYQAITAYELHLRYYIEVQRWAGCPFAFHTVGSSMAVRAEAYQAQGGMNRRKAGEDFYFLHKFIPLGGFGEINTTTVIPSPRTSDRVPFGTGKSVYDILENSKGYQTYAPETFQDLKKFLQNVPGLYQPDGLERQWNDYPSSVRSFLTTVNFAKKIEEIKANIADEQQFTPRFYRWFNAFLLMKFVHHSRDHFYPNVEVSKAAKWMLKEEGSEMELLKVFRKKQRNSSFAQLERG